LLDVSLVLFGSSSSTVVVLPLELHASPTFITSTREPRAASTAQMPREMVRGGRLVDASAQAVTQLGPPQSTPSSFPFRTPSLQDTSAPGISTHALPTRTYDASHTLHASPT
jgi:hypothetical protein